MKLIDEARHAWKMASVWVAGVWAAVSAYFIADPSGPVALWQSIPAEIRPDMPHWMKGVLFGAAMFGSIFAARIVKQKLTSPNTTAN